MVLVLIVVIIFTTPFIVGVNFIFDRILRAPDTDELKSMKYEMEALRAVLRIQRHRGEDSDTKYKVDRKTSNTQSPFPTLRRLSLVGNRILGRQRDIVEKANAMKESEKLQGLEKSLLSLESGTPYPVTLRQPYTGKFTSLAAGFFRSSAEPRKDVQARHGHHRRANVHGNQVNFHVRTDRDNVDVGVDLTTDDDNDDVSSVSDWGGSINGDTLSHGAMGVSVYHPQDTYTSLKRVHPWSPSSGGDHLFFGAKSKNASGRIGRNLEHAFALTMTLHPDFDTRNRLNCCLIATKDNLLREIDELKSSKAQRSLERSIDNLLVQQKQKQLSELNRQTGVHCDQSLMAFRKARERFSIIKSAIKGGVFRAMRSISYGDHCEIFSWDVRNKSIATVPYARNFGKSAAADILFEYRELCIELEAYVCEFRRTICLDRDRREFDLQWGIHSNSGRRTIMWKNHVFIANRVAECLALKRFHLKKLRH